MRYRSGGLISGEAYTWRGLFSEFYGSLENLIKDQRMFPLMIILLFLITFSINDVLTCWEKIDIGHSWDLQG